MRHDKVYYTLLKQLWYSSEDPGDVSPSMYIHTADESCRLISRDEVCNDVIQGYSTGILSVKNKKPDDLE